MKKNTVIAVLLAAFFVAACDGISGIGGTSDIKSFNYALQGTWASNDSGIYSGSLKIDHDRITIRGYSEGQTPFGGNDNNRPFKNFTKGIALKGYSEEGKIFIEDAGSLQEGIPYTYWEETPPPAYKKLKFLRFTFGGRVETLQNQ
jgi:predicted small secreted protein